MADVDTDLKSGAEMSPDSASEMSVQGVTVLLVEDDLFFAGRLLSMLDKAGYRALTARTKEQALERLDSEAPAVVILNLAQARLGGAELITEVKARQPETKVLAFLSHTKIPPVRDAVRAAGADKICANSAVTMRLSALLENLLQGRGAAADLEDEE